MSKMAIVTANTPPTNNAMKCKTVAEENMKFIRILFFITTVIFIIIGTLMVVLGIAVYLEYHDFSFFIESVKSGRILTPSVMTAIAGFVLLVVAFFGFVGSMKLSTYMINFYAVFLALLVILKVVIVSLAFTNDADTLARSIHLPIYRFGSDPEIEHEIDTLQRSLECCGGDSFLDYLGMEFAEHQNTTFIMKEYEGNLVVMVLPESCCVVRENNRCTTMHRMSCKAALVNATLQNVNTIGILGVSVMIVMLLGIFFALLLARSIRKLKSERALIEWKMKEQMIIERQNAMKAETVEQAVYITQTQSVNLA